MHSGRFDGFGFLREGTTRVVTPLTPAQESAPGHACSCTLPPVTTTALERVQARAAAITAHRAAIESDTVTPPNAPAAPTTPATPTGPSDDVAVMRAELDDLMSTYSELVDRVGVLEQAAVADALEDLDQWTEPDEDMAMMAAAKELYGEVTYADTGMKADGQKRYPIDTAEHVRAAWSYINQAKNRTDYSAADLATIEGRIKSAAKKFDVTISEG